MRNPIPGSGTHLRSPPATTEQLDELGNSMNWLLFILRLVFGRPALESSDLRRVAVWSDGRTLMLPTETVPVYRPLWRWEWLRPHAFRLNADLGLHCAVSDFEHGFTRNASGGGMRRRMRSKYRFR